jgi:hypothetical protein
MAGWYKHGNLLRVGGRVAPCISIVLSQLRGIMIECDELKKAVCVAVRNKELCW